MLGRARCTDVRPAATACLLLMLGCVSTGKPPLRQPPTPCSWRQLLRLPPPAAEGGRRQQRPMMLEQKQQLLLTVKTSMAAAGTLAAAGTKLQHTSGVLQAALRQSSMHVRRPPNRAASHWHTRCRRCRCNLRALLA